MVNRRDVRPGSQLEREIPSGDQGQARKRWATVVVKGRRWIGKLRRVNRRIRVPASMFPCTIEEKLKLEDVNGEEMQRYETRVTNKDGNVTVYPGRCPRFLTDDGAMVDQVGDEGRNPRSGFASRPLPQHGGNRNGWISEEARDEVESDLESTATSRFFQDV